MNISIKNKFSMIIIFMSVLSLFFAYIISNEFISKNLMKKELLRENEKVIYVGRDIENIENKIFSDLKIYAKSEVIQNFFKDFNKKNNSSKENIDKAKFFLDVYFKENFNFLENIEVIFINKNNFSSQKMNLELANFFYVNKSWKPSSIYYWKKNKLNRLIIVPIYKEGTNISNGSIILNFTIGEKFFNRLKEIYFIDFILYKDKNITLTTLGKDINNIFFRKNVLEVKGKLFQIKKLKILDENLYGVFNRESFLNETSELSSYLFIALFFCFYVIIYCC